MRQHLFLLFAVALAAGACAKGDSETSDAGGSSAADGGAAPLRLNQLQLKATHNSYHVEKPGTTLADWKYSEAPLTQQISAQGVRGFELDTHFDPKTMQLTVHHVPMLDDGTTCDTLEACMTELKRWSDAHPKHHTLFIHIEPKDAEVGEKPDYALYTNAFDKTLLDVWGRERIVAPMDVQGDAKTLREAVVKHGWPSVESTRGKVLVYLDNRGEFHQQYTHASPRGRLAFPSSMVDEDFAAIVISNDPTDPATKAAVKQGFIVRTRADGVPLPDDIDGQRAAALASGAQIVSTDFPVAVGKVDGFDLPGGTPSRCNPVTAPDGCQASDVEDLDRH